MSITVPARVVVPVPDALEVPPAYLWRPPTAVRSLAPRIMRALETVGRYFEPEQAFALDAISVVRADGRPATLASAVVSARQNLKTYVAEGYVMGRIVDPTDPAELFIWSAQQLDTTEETFEHFLSVFDNKEFPHMRRRFVKATSGNGAAEMKFRVDGRIKRIKFKARSRKSGQGLAGDEIVLDEGFAVEPMHLGALVPTLSTRKRAHILWASSAPHASSGPLHAVVRRGRAGGPGAPAYVEWCAPGGFEAPPCERGLECTHAPGVPGCVLDDREHIRAANPTAGRRISWEYLENERLELGALEFARERLGWAEPEASAEKPPVSLELWTSRTDEGSAPADETEVVFAVEIAANRSSASISVAGWRATEGERHLGLIDRRPGVEWVLPRLLELAERDDLARVPRGPQRSPVWCHAIAIDPVSPAGSLIEPLRQAGVEPVVMTAREVGTACAELEDGLKAGRYWHRSSVDVDEAVKGAVRRDIGEGQWAFGRRASSRSKVEIDAVVSVTNAAWCLSLTPPPVDVSESLY